MNPLLETGTMPVLKDDGPCQACLRHSGLLAEKVDDARLIHGGHGVESRYLDRYDAMAGFTLSSKPPGACQFKPIGGVADDRRQPIA